METHSPPAPSRIIRMRELEGRIGQGRSTIYEMINAGEFPAPISLGGRRVGFLESEVEDWIASRPRVAIVGQQAEQVA